jgi:hypothetical protein
MAAGSLDILIEQGATFIRTITVTDSNDEAVDLTGASARGKIRPSYDSDTFVSFDMTITDDEGGIVEWLMDAETTSDLDITRTVKWVYDVEIEYADGRVDRILQGKATLSPEATK